MASGRKQGTFMLCIRWFISQTLLIITRLCTMNSLLINYHDAVIYPSDLSLLDSSTAWLNDACVHFQMTRLQHRHRQSDDVQTKEDAMTLLDGHQREEKRQRVHRCGQGNDEPHVEQLEDLFLDP